MTGRLVVHRPWRVQNLFEAYLLEIDGRTSGRVKAGRRVAVELGTGVHEVRIRLDTLGGKMGYCGGLPWPVEIVDGEVVTLRALPLLPPTPIGGVVDSGVGYDPAPEAWLMLVPVEATDDHDR